MSAPPSPAELADQLRYLREAVDTRDRPRDPSLPLAVLWAMLTTAGFALVDLRPQWVGAYWLAVAPLGLLASAWLGRRAATRSGVRRAGIAARQVLHWGLILPAWAAVVAIAVAHRLPGAVVGSFMALVVGIVWFLGGLHLDRRFLVPGGLLIAGAAALPLLPLLPWTLLGAAVGGALIVAAARARVHDELAQP